ncbi:MAG: hypothetical protein COW84_07575 [Gammaproteobacteria bacterium CG22_combo_CG10-13_8_21_14_all_40_8]|nr:MAG: hypothetical protein COW84_07575 [Gammaproteobacteria bacterium CG22_combo_CG10-13_8_21_14_all_40_8]
MLNHKILVIGLLVSSLSINLFAQSDPTKPPGKRYDAGQLKKQKILILEAMATGANPWALISGHLIRPGETVAGIKLLSIEKQKAIVWYQNKKTGLKWNATQVKTPVKLSK